MQKSVILIYHDMYIMCMQNGSGTVQKKVISLGLPEKESLEDAEKAMINFSKE